MEDTSTMDRKIKLVELNPHISCQICKGYLIDATTIKECLHTFCKSCLVKHLQDTKTCPTCDILIHQSYPLNFISYDRTMQDILYKLIPNLQSNEIKREKEFYRKRGLPYPKANTVQAKEDSNSLSAVHGGSKSTASSNSTLKYNNNGKHCNASNGTTNGVDITKDEDSDYHRSDEQVNVVIESQPGCTLKTVKRKFIRCSAHTTVTHLKKFIAKKLHNNIDRYKDIDILCDDQLLGKDHTLKFVFVTRWRFKQPPLKLTYRPRIELI